MSHYESLGVGKSASKDEIRHAFKRKAAKTHPDKGGSEEDFKQVQRAYAVLRDDSKRSRYDAGEEEPVADPRQRAMSELGGLFTAMMEAPGAEGIDLIKEMNKAVRIGIAGDKSKMAENRRAIVMRERLLKRIHYKGTSSNFLAAVAEADIRRRQGTISMLEEKAKVYDEMLGLLRDYEMEVKEKPQRQPIRQNHSIQLWEL